MAGSASILSKETKIINKNHPNIFKTLNLSIKPPPSKTILKCKLRECPNTIYIGRIKTGRLGTGWTGRDGDRGMGVGRGGRAAAAAGMWRGMPLSLPKISVLPK